MVFFVCDGCNESLKKNKVDGHAARCRTCYAVTCIDCSVSFPNDEYRSHTSCISEVEKYQKTTAFKKPVGNMQQQWMHVVETSTDFCTPELKNICEMLVNYDNVPRKKAKFMNFMQNSLQQYNKVKNEALFTLLNEAMPSKVFQVAKVETPPPVITNKVVETKLANDSVKSFIKPCKGEWVKLKSIVEKLTQLDKMCTKKQIVQTLYKEFKSGKKHISYQDKHGQTLPNDVSIPKFKKCKVGYKIK